MGIFFTTLNQLIHLFLLIGLGYFLRKKQYITSDTTKSLSTLLLNVVLPSFIIISLQIPYTYETFLNGSIFFGISIILHLTGLFLGIVSFKLFKGRDIDDAVWFCGSMLPNLSFMGIPVIKAILGDEPLFYISIASIVFNLFAFTLGTYLYTRKKHIKSNYINLIISPVNCAFIIALLFFLLSIKLPMPIYATLKSLTSLITPLSMIIIGAMISQITIHDIFKDKDIYVISFVRLIAAPAVFIIIIKQLTINTLMMQTAVMLIAMPCATITALLASQNESNEDFASKAVFISTLLCIITLPIFSMIIV